MPSGITRVTEHGNLVYIDKDGKLRVENFRSTRVTKTEFELITNFIRNLDDMTFAWLNPNGLEYRTNDGRVITMDAAAPYIRSYQITNSPIVDFACLGDTRTLSVFEEESPIYGSELPEVIPFQAGLSYFGLPKKYQRVFMIKDVVCVIDEQSRLRLYCPHNGDPSPVVDFLVDNVFGRCLLFIYSVLNLIVSFLLLIPALLIALFCIFTCADAFCMNSETPREEICFHRYVDGLGRRLELFHFDHLMTSDETRLGRVREVCLNYFLRQFPTVLACDHCGDGVAIVFSDNTAYYMENMDKFQCTMRSLGDDIVDVHMSNGHIVAERTDGVLRIHQPRSLDVGTVQVELLKRGLDVLLK
jgi:hypothetical protein